MLTQQAEVSLISCGAGGDLYSTFGHSAIMISDRQTGLDRVYNYGTFDFDTPNFYVKFTRGKLEYILNVTTFQRFVASYQYEGRWVRRQVLNLKQGEKEKLYAFLENNAKPENRGYKYDFFYDNCSTRIRDVIEDILGENLVYPSDRSETTQTFRDLIQLQLNNHPWSDLGIDLALGMPCDYLASWREQMFLPDFLMSHLGDARVIRGSEILPLVKSETVILKENAAVVKESAGINWIFWILFGVSLLSTIFVSPRKMKWFDVVLFSLVGILGIVILLLWFATDHSTTTWNLNILWALPSWLYGAILLIKGKNASRFFKFHAIFMFALIVFWGLIPQDFHMAVIPIILALAARSWSWQKRKHILEKTEI